MLKCQKCNRIIVDVTNEGGVKVRSRMIVFNGSEAHAICPSCKTSVPVPLIVDISQLPPPSNVKHIIHKRN